MTVRDSIPSEKFIQRKTARSSREPLQKDVAREFLMAVLLKLNCAPVISTYIESPLLSYKVESWVKNSLVLYKRNQ